MTLIRQEIFDAIIRRGYMDGPNDVSILKEVQRLLYEQDVELEQLRKKNADLMSDLKMLQAHSAWQREVIEKARQA
jgi:predicted nuclease with TOPRIM domain